MADRTDFFFRQRVTEAELDLAFALLEKADHNLATDLGVFGVIRGAVPTPHQPVADLSIDLTAPACGYDRLGQRLFIGTSQVVNCATDLTGIPTEVTTAGQERWLGVFVRFSRLLSDPRTDGNSQSVFFRRDESFEIVVRQGPQGAAGAAAKVALQPDELLVCDVLRRPGQIQIVAADIDISRRQAFVFAQGSSVAVQPALWHILHPTTANAQAALDAVDDELLGHFEGRTHRHSGLSVDFSPHGFVSATNTQAALHELIDDLGSGADGASGAYHVGADAVPGTPNALGAGTVDSQLSSLLGLLNAHQGAVTAGHPASAISALTHGLVRGTNVQSQLQEIGVAFSATTAGQAGSSRVGADLIEGSPHALAGGSVRDQLASLLGIFNVHVDPFALAHHAESISIFDATRQIQGEQVEAALAEIFGAFRADHNGFGDGTLGWHKTVRQGVLAAAGTKALLWDAQGVGGEGGHLRIYLDADSLWITLNALWNVNSWNKDSTRAASVALVLSRFELVIAHHQRAEFAFTAWTSTQKLTLGTASGFEVSGTNYNTGRVGLWVHNDQAVARQVTVGTSVTFRNRFSAAPSTITLTPIATGPGAWPQPTVTGIDQDGFSVSATLSVAAGTTTFWTGSYSAQ